jgi:hypothetical protein
LGGGLNTYGYVDGNPLSGVDSLGLTREDIDAAFELISEAYPMLDVPNPADVETDRLRPNAVGETSPICGDITLDDQFLIDLEEPGLRDLLYVAMHEVIHRNQSILQRLLDAPVDFPPYIQPDHPEVKAWANILVSPIVDKFVQDRMKNQQQRR